MQVKVKNAVFLARSDGQIMVYGAGFMRDPDEFTVEMYRKWHNLPERFWEFIGWQHGTVEVPDLKQPDTTEFNPAA